MNNLLIKNINIIYAFQNFHGDVYIEDGKIKAGGDSVWAKLRKMLLKR